MDVTKADKNTPRGLIQALLSTASVSRSARVTRASSRNIKTPVTTKKLSTDLLKRTRSSTKRKAVAAEVATPSEDATPRTLIGQLLEVQSASNSVVTNKRRRTADQVATEAHTSSSTATAASVRKEVLKTPSENITPRTVIHSILKAATVESPAVHTGPINVPSPVNHAAESQSDKSEISLPTILEQEDESEEEKEDEMTKPISHGTESENETEKGLNVDEDKNNGLAEEDEDITTQPALSRDNDNADWLGSTQEFGQDDHESVNCDEDVISQSLQTELVTVVDEEDANQSQQTGLFGVRAQSKDKSRWRNLVTPHIVPRDNTTVQLSGVLSSEQDLGSQKPVKRRSPTGKAPRVKNPARNESSLPSSLVKGIFQHFSKTKVSREALQLVEQGSQLFFKQMTSDLMAYCQHAGRNTIETADIELLIKRQGFITDKQNLHCLIEKHLPMEYRQEIIPTVQSGNTILLK